jgi:membrane protein YdbS with pleckstrin-like domain
MFDLLRTWLLRVMRVPHEPSPPIGAPGSIRVFRAGRNYYNLRLARWGLGQVGATAGLCFSLMFFWWFRGEMEAGRQAALSPAPAAAATVAPAVPEAKPAPTVPTRTDKLAATEQKKRLIRARIAKGIASKTDPWMIVVLEIFEVGGVLLFLAQIPVSFALVRLDYELHWYIVTDRSLRIRTGVLRLQESTMSFANLQQVEVQQGPLQRLLGLADVHVQSAGGAGDQKQAHGQAGDSLHSGIFHSVDNAQEIRDLILDRLRQFRQAGLGDPDDHHDQAHGGGVPSPREASSPNADTLTAARELLAEARALRASLG